jgi:hypothetical protein
MKHLSGFIAIVISMRYAAERARSLILPMVSLASHSFFRFGERGPEIIDAVLRQTMLRRAMLSGKK